MTFVVPLGELGRGDLALAGGKGANLGELVRAGLPVPDGFVVTTDAYAACVSPLDLKITERVGAGGGASIRADIETAAMPAELCTEIADAYARLGAGPVAVRSSAGHRCGPSVRSPTAIGSRSTPAMSESRSWCSA